MFATAPISLDNDLGVWMKLKGRTVLSMNSIDFRETGYCSLRRMLAC